MPKETFYNLNETKQNKIDDILLNIFAKNNIATISVSQIVNEMQMSRGAFYKYFTDLFDAYQYITSKAMIYIHKGILAEIHNNDYHLYQGLRSYVLKFARLNNEDLLYKYFILLNNVQNDDLISLPSSLDIEDWQIIFEKSALEFNDNQEKISYLIFIMSNLVSILKRSLKKEWNDKQLLRQYDYFISWLK